MASDDVPYVDLEIPARYKIKRALKGEDDSLKYCTQIHKLHKQSVT